MIYFGTFLNAFAEVTDLALQLYSYAIIGRAIISWVNPDPYNPIVNFLYRITEPVLYRVRRILPDLGGLDLSPIVVLLGIYFLRLFAVQSVRQMALGL